MGGKRSKPTSTTNTIQIPPFLQPFAEQSAGVGSEALTDLQQLLQGGNLVAPLAPQQQQAIDLGTASALDPSGPYAAAINQLQGTAQGDFFGAPGYQEAVDAAFRRNAPGILSQFIGRGRGTGGLAGNAIAQTIADSQALQFGNERNRQLLASSLLPSAAGAPVGILGQLGGLVQGQAQNEINAPISAQQQLLGASGGAINPAAFLGQQQRQETFRNPLSSALGGGLTGAGLFGAGGPLAGAAGITGPWGALGGAILGGLFG